MKKSPYQGNFGKKGTVVAKTKDLSQEPAMKKLKKLYQGMTPEEQERTKGYLNQKGNKGVN